VPTWQIIFVRCIMLTAYAAWRLYRSSCSPVGKQ
jgi:hypothetical protein